MEVSSNEDQEIPMPINTSYGGAHGHLIHHHHHHHNNEHHPLNPPPPPPPPAAATIPPLSTAPPITIPPPTMSNNNGNTTTTALSIVVDDQQQQQQKKKRSSNSNVRYRECLKNHAASMGGTATDGCGEFMPSGEDGSIEALTCSACNCHRNFHRKEIQVDFPTLLPHHHPGRIITKTNNLNHHHHHEKQLLLGHPHHQMVMSYNMAAAAAAGGSLSQSDDHDGVQELEEPHQDDGNNKMTMMGGGNSGAATSHHHHHRHYNNNSQGMGKKRFRTKFSVAQKEKMLEFAESVGWKIQKQEESVVQRFCQEIGVKRRVLKVWMHNNKHSHASPKHAAGGAGGDHQTVVAPVINTSVLHPPSTAT